MAVQETGKAILSVLDLDQLLTIIMNILSNVCRLNKAIILLVNQDTRCLEFMHALGFGDEIPEEVKNYIVSIDRVSNILARVASTGRSEYVPNVKVSTLKKDNILLSKLEYLE